MIEIFFKTKNMLKKLVYSFFFVEKKYLTYDVNPKKQQQQ